jgi:prepilin-type N-terminal cleavage/methylation domain-containing protein
MVKRKRSKGFTLTEAILVIAIASIVATLGNILFINIIRFFRLNQARIEVQRDARAAFNLIGRNLRQSVSTSVVIDNVSGQPPYSRITFNLVTGRTMMYYQNGTQLYQVSQSTEVISNNLEYIAFSHPRTDDDSIVSISLTMSKPTYQGGHKALQLSIEKIRIMN